MISPPIVDKNEVLSQNPDYFGSIPISGAGLVTENGDHHWHIFFEEHEDTQSQQDGDTIFVLTFFLINNRMLSQGSVKLLDNNPESPPLIDFNYLNDPNDIELVIKSLKQAREFLYDTGEI